MIIVGTDFIVYDRNNLKVIKVIDNVYMIVIIADDKTTALYYENINELILESNITYDEKR